jgi:hypothetical protein
VLKQHAVRIGTWIGTCRGAGCARRRRKDPELVTVAAQRKAWSGDGIWGRDGEGLYHTQGSAQDSML